MKRKNLLKWLILAGMTVCVCLLSGCGSQPDPVEDPLSAFGIDAVLPFETVAPEVMATPTPAPTTDPDKLITDPTYGQEWKKEDVGQDDEWPEEETPKATPKPTKKPQTSAYTSLSYGDSGSDVSALQKRLKALGYYSGSVDAKYGSGTVAAVKLYQSIVGLPQSGVATAELQEELFSANAPKYKATPSPKPATTPTGYVQLEKGDTGSQVTRLQNRLKTLGYYTGAADGEYGSGTVSAVKRFQKAVGVSATGVATTALQKKLFSSSAPKYQAATPAPAPEEDTYVRLAQGSSGTKVKALQKRLKELGYYTGAADGNFGSGTAGAVKRFQKAIGVNVTGVATAALQKKLFSSNAPEYEGDDEDDDSEYIQLSPGDTGAEVKKLQKRLKKLGYFDGDIGGNYLTKTTDAVKRFQKAIGVKTTGIATVALQKKLFSSNAPKYQPDEPTPTPVPEYTELQSGSKGTAVSRLQKRLKDLDYYNGSVSGTFGAKTEEAVKAFEKRYGRKPTGVATIALQKKLFSSDALPYEEEQESEYTPLAKGDSGSEVKKLQRRLKELGYFEGSIGGNYQKLTEDAVKRFQQAVGAKVNGKASVKVQELLFSGNAPIYQPDATPTPDVSRPLSRGDTGVDVENLQRRLCELGYIHSKDDIIVGTFDKNTELAVIDAQNDRGYDSDGAADEEFLIYIYSEDVWDVALRDYPGG